MAVSPLFRKLNLKSQPTIHVLSAPDSFEPELARLGDIDVRRTLPRARGVEFLLAFVMREQDIEKIASRLSRIAPGDPVIWFAYPKRTSKRYECRIDRDTGWAALGAAGFEGVRLVAIDEDWSAARFRRAEFIRTMKRDAKRAMSSSGRARTAPK